MMDKFMVDGEPLGLAWGRTAPFDGPEFRFDLLHRVLLCNNRPVQEVLWIQDLENLSAWEFVLHVEHVVERHAWLAALDGCHARANGVWDMEYKAEQARRRACSQMIEIFEAYSTKS